MTPDASTPDASAITEADLLREIEKMIRVEPGDLTQLPWHVAEYIRHSQELLVTTARERDEWKRRAAKHGCDVERGDPDCG